MSDTAIGNGIDVRADLGNGPEAVYAYWMEQYEIALKEDEDWVRRGDKVIERYRDERKDAQGNRTDVHRFNILWSNVQTLKPVLYARTPKPVVQRRFLDNDPAGRLASILLERALSYSLDTYDFDAIMEACVEDRLLPGRAVVRVLYVPHYGEEIDGPSPEAQFHDVEEADAVVASPGDAQPARNSTTTASSDPGVAGATPGPVREITYEEVCVKYVYWKNYRESPARTWDEVYWISFEVFMTREELIRRFGRKIGSAVQLDSIGGTSDDSRLGRRRAKSPPDIYKKARVLEFWDKDRRQVIWIAPSTPGVVLDQIDDPLLLPDFFPVPPPLLATTTTNKRVPIPDYTEYQDQADELDLLTARIDRLTRALKVAGIYAGSEKQVLQQLFSEGTENKLIAVEDWSGFAQQKGGLDNLVQWVPIKQVAEVLQQLMSMREASKQIIYEITGIGDIVRGSTQPMETAAAQKLKASFSTRRQVPEQKRVARFARDIVRLMAAIISEHFSPQTISAITGYPQLAPVPPIPPQPPQFLGGNVVPGPGFPAAQQPGMAPQLQLPPQPQPNPAYAQWQQQVQAAQAVMAANAKLQAEFDAACALIRRDGVTGFRLDIESDSTIALDEAAERADRNEFMGALLPVLEQLVPMAQGNPELAEFSKQFVLFGVRGYPVARTLEDSIEKLFDSVASKPPLPPKGAAGKAPENPQVAAAKIQQEAQADKLKAQTDQAATAQRAQADAASTAQKAQQSAMEIAQKDRAMQAQIEIANIKAETERQRAMTDIAIQQSEADDARRREDISSAAGLV